MNKETIEEAANNWLDSFYQKEKEYDKTGRNKCSPQLGFVAGAEWQKEQSATDAIEFAEWLDIATKQSENRCFIERSEGYTYPNLYKLWQKSKSNADN